MTSNPAPGATARAGIKASLSVSEVQTPGTQVIGAAAPDTPLSGINTIQTASEVALIEHGFPDPQFTAIDADTLLGTARCATILEALCGWRGMLSAAKSRAEQQSSLNPSSKEQEILAINVGIARAEVLISELDPEPKAS